MIGVWLVERLSLMRGTLLITEDGDEIAVEEIIDALAAITRERDEAKEVLRKILECDYDAIETARDAEIERLRREVDDLKRKQATGED